MENAHLFGVRSTGELGDEASLSHAGLALDQQQLRPPHIFERGVEQPQLIVAPDHCRGAAPGEHGRERQNCSGDRLPAQLVSCDRPRHTFELQVAHESHRALPVQGGSVPDRF